jgi:hypothetical protein
VLGRPAPASSGSEPINTGLNRDLLELQRLINCLPLSVVKKRRFHRQLIALSAKASGSGMFDERPLIDAELAATILASYDKGNSAVARTYLQRSTLFYDAPDPKRDSSSEGGGLTVEKLVYAIGWLLTADEPDRGHDDAT